MKNWTALLLAALFAYLASENVVGQELYRSGLDDATGWTIVADDDTEYEFGFDYTRYGIPLAPNGTDGLGLRMAANISEPRGPAVISAFPDDLELSGRFLVQVDMWINYNTSGGTTEFIGGFVGFDPFDGLPLSGVGFLGDSDGDTARDYRLFRDDVELLTSAGQYALTSNNNTDPVLAAHFPGQSTPEMQIDPAMFDPPNDMVRAPDGTLGYGWHELMVTVDTTTGYATFDVDGLRIGTVQADGGDPLDLSGSVALTYADLLASVSDRPQFSFGVFDNLVISMVPEPSAGLLGLFVIAAMLLARARFAI